MSRSRGDQHRGTSVIALAGPGDKDKEKVKVKGLIISRTRDLLIIRSNQGGSEVQTNAMSRQKSDRPSVLEATR